MAARGRQTTSPLRAAAGSVIAGQGYSPKGPDGAGADEPSVQARHPGLLPGWPASVSIASKAYRIAADPGGERYYGRRYSDHDRAHSRFAERCPYRRGIHGMPKAQVTVTIVKHAVNPGEKYGKLTIIREVRKVAAGGKSDRAVRCRCDCGNELTTALRSVVSGDARSCGCSRGRPKYEWKRCPVCGRRAQHRVL
jgi:hypothetical protein